ncbi:MAG: class I SAM-dependent methyltransferase [Patescibacteria group bacterium]
MNGNTTLNRELAVWSDYALEDSGGLLKCERFGGVVLVRPEAQAIWAREDEESFKTAKAVFEQKGEDGSWRVRGEMPEDWTVKWENLVFRLRLSSFKHTGIFPEQAANWAYIRANVKPKSKVLNLFGYTGGATLAALSVGAEVAHVDASRSAVTSAKENAVLSGFADRPVRWLVEDAMKFVEREGRRNHYYDAIIMDPPAFGRGPNKEVWQFEKGLVDLLLGCKKVLHTEHGQILLNAYSLGFPALAVEQTVRSVFPKLREVTTVELVLRENTKRKFLLPAGLTVRASV